MARVVFSASLPVLLCCFLLFLACPVPAVEVLAPKPPVPGVQGEADLKADQKNVTIRIGRHQGFVRFVFMTSEGNVQSAQVKRAAKDTIALEFPPALNYHLTERGALKVDSAVELAKDIKILVKRAGCSLIVENLNDFKVSKLSSPPRLVIDAVNGLLPPPAAPEKAPAAAAPTVPLFSPATFVIDAGHGGYDRGIQGSGFVEKELTLSIARDLAGSLTKKGKRVFVTRKSDQVMTIRDRLKIAGQRSPDLFVSIHVSSDAKCRVYRRPEVNAPAAEDQRTEPQVRARSLSQGVAEALSQSMQTEMETDVEMRVLPLPLVERTKGPSLLVELPNPDLFSYEGKGREKVIAALVKGLTMPQPAP